MPDLLIRETVFKSRGATSKTLSDVYYYTSDVFYKNSPHCSTRSTDTVSDINKSGISFFMIISCHTVGEYLATIICQIKR